MRQFFFQIVHAVIISVFLFGGSVCGPYATGWRTIPELAWRACFRLMSPFMNADLTFR
jgi:hypothetical protein